MSDIWDDALAEAYVSAPSDDVILATLELRHPSFVDEEGHVTPIRIVCEDGELQSVTDDGVEVYGWMCTLEPEAPVGASTSVLFQSCEFDFTFPEQTQDKLPSMNIEIVNVTRQVSKYLDAAVESRAVVEVTYREFLWSDRTSPKYIMGGLSMTSVESTLFRVTGAASFTDLINKSFPRKVYRPEEYRGLAST